LAIHDEIEQSFLAQSTGEKRAGATTATTTATRKLKAAQPAEMWVNKWVDYSNKYGMGYLLSNGRMPSPSPSLSL
jgi:hypothetical protein